MIVFFQLFRKKKKKKSEKERKNNNVRLLGLTCLKIIILFPSSK